MLAAAQLAGGVRVEFEPHADEDESLEDVIDDLDDPWMRNPAAPEWAETLASDAVDTAASAGGSSGGAGGISTATCRQLLAKLAATQQPLVIVEVLPQQQQQQQQQQQEQQLLLVMGPDGSKQHLRQARPLPDPVLPWLVAHAAAADEGWRRALEQQDGLQLASLPLEDVCKELADAWRARGAVVAVWDSGHHGCLAAAIRLSAVYRLPDVLLLQEERRQQPADA